MSNIFAAISDQCKFLWPKIVTYAKYIKENSWIGEDPDGDSDDDEMFDYDFRDSPHNIHHD